MTIRFPRGVSVLSFALALSLVAHADEPKENAKDEVLPKGAKLRLGDPRLVFRIAPTFAPLPPEYKAFVVNDGLEGLRRYDLSTGRPLDRDKANTTGIGGGQLVVSGDGKRYVAAHPGILTVRETATGKEINALKPPAGFVATTVPNASVVSLSTDGKVMAQGGSIGQTGGIVVWDVERGSPIFQTAAPLSGPAIPVLSPDGKLLAVRATGFRRTLPAGKPDDDATRALWVYEVEGGKELLKGKVTASTIQNASSIAFSPDGSSLAASAGEGVIDVFDLKTGQPKPPIIGRNGQGARVAYSQDGKILAAVSADGAVQRWKAINARPLDTTDGPTMLTGSPQGLVFADNDRLLAWGNMGNCPLVWEAPSGKVLTQLPEHSVGIRSIAFGSDGKEIITVGLDGRIVRWDAATGKSLGPVTLKLSRSLMNTTGIGIGLGNKLLVNLTPDGTRAVTTSTPPAVMDLATGTEEFSLPRSIFIGQYATSIPSADMTKMIILASSYDRTKPGRCIVWDLTTRQKVIEIEMGITPGFLPTAAISPSGKRLVTLSRQPGSPAAPQPVVVAGWDLQTGKKLAEVSDTMANGSVFVAAANDSFAVVSSGPGRLRAFDYEHGKAGDEFDAGKMGAEAVTGPVVFSPDGKQFMSSGAAEEAGLFAVKIHDWPSGKLVHTFTGHRGAISAVTFSQDGKTLATGSHDGTVLVWDLTTLPAPK